MTANMLATPLTRRQFTISTAVGAAAAAGFASLTLPAAGVMAAAQDTSDFASLGYPELAVTVTDSSMTACPPKLLPGAICSRPLARRIRSNRLQWPSFRPHRQG